MTFEGGIFPKQFYKELKTSQLLPEAAPPSERAEKRRLPEVNWNVPVRILKQFGTDLKEASSLKSPNLKTFLPKEALTWVSAAISEIPGLGQLAGLGLMAVGTAAMTAKEIGKWKQLHTEEYFSRSAMIQTITAIIGVVQRRGNEIAQGKREIGKGLTQNLELTNAETAVAGVAGLCASFVSMALLSDISLVNILHIPGLKAVRRLLTPLVASSIARGFALLGAGYYSTLVEAGKLSAETAGKRKEQFTEQCLRVNAPTIQLITFANMGLEGIKQIHWADVTQQVNEFIHNLRTFRPAATATAVPPATVTPTPTVSPTPTSEATLAENLKPTLTATLQAATATGTPPSTDTLMPPTETPPPPPTPTDFWHPGEHDLSAVQMAGHEAGELRYGSETWHLYNLDNDPNPDYAIDNNGHTVMWELANGRYAVDPDHDGKANGSYSLEELLPYFPTLTPTPQSGVVSGGAKMAALLPLRQAEGVLPPAKNLDLNNSPESEEIKVVADASGHERYYLDRSNNGLDLDDSGKPLAGDDVEIKITWLSVGGVSQPQKIEFPNDDGSYWEWNAELGRYQGFSADGGKLAVAGGQHGNLQGKVIDEHGLVYSPKEIGAAAFRACQNNPDANIDDVIKQLNPRADGGVLGPWVKPVVATPEPQPQSWEGMAIDAHGGAEGIIQGAIHQANPDLDRNVAGQIAAQVAVEQHLNASGLQLNAGLSDLGHGNAGAIIEAVNRNFVRHSLMGIFQHTYHLNYQQAMEASSTASLTSSLTNAQGQIFAGEIGKPCLGAFGLSDDWEQWLRDCGYIK